MFGVLDEREIQKMLEWLPHLDDSYPEAVTLLMRCPTIRIENSHTLRELISSDLVTKFSKETAELLIYFSNCSGNLSARYLSKIEARLSLIPIGVRRNLDEAFARAGVNKNPN